MIQRQVRLAWGLAAAVVCGQALTRSAAQEQGPASNAGAEVQKPGGQVEAPPAGPVDTPPGPAPCTVDLALPGVMRDILSNALTRGLMLPQRDVAIYLDGAAARFATGQELLTAAAAHFQLAEDALAAKVEKYKHCNCTHPVESALHPQLRTDPGAPPDCDADLELAGFMADILSNALVLGMDVPEKDVRALLRGAHQKYEDGAAVFAAAASHFQVSPDALAAKVHEYRHCTCEHARPRRTQAAGAESDAALPVSKFAKDVTLHVVLHELGHAIIREFDIPILANEETMADAFATYYLTTYMPERALDVLSARTTSLMIEAGEDEGVDWSGEHDHDARRANQIAALAVAADPVKYRPVADVVGMSEEDIEKAVDYGGEMRRSWRRVLAPLWMPDGAASSEARVLCDDGSAFLIRLCEDGLAREIEAAVGRFDWHSQVTVRFVEGDGKAGWNRSARTVTVHSAYVRRFIEQGLRGLPGGAK